MTEDLLPWEREVLAEHRWGMRGEDTAKGELVRLRQLYGAAAPLGEGCEQIVDQIVVLEICNWRLEESLLALCEAIGVKRPVPWPVGHKASVTPERWQRIWAYYLSLRAWLSDVPPQRRGYAALLAQCDPGGEAQQHISGMLGERDELKELRVERFCLYFELWLDGLPGGDRPHKKALDAAAGAIDAEIERVAPNDEFEHAERGFAHRMRMADNGQLHPCHHKLFRRYDIIISSIGEGQWRKAMPYRGTDGSNRADLADRYLDPIDAWIEGATEQAGDAAKIHELLGERDDVKVFLASLLVSLMRPQQSLAREWAEQAAKSKS